MPNLVPPVTTTDMALAYRLRILEHVPAEYKGRFQPLMTLYLTDATTPEEIVKAKESGHVYAVKLYPQGATTNSHAGVTDIEKVMPALQAMEKASVFHVDLAETRRNPPRDLTPFSRSRPPSPSPSKL
jgi:dihydroorotase